MLLAGLLFCFLINATPTLAQALESIPVLGSVVRVVDLRTYTWNWGGTGETVQTPVLEGDPGAVDALDAGWLAVSSKTTRRVKTPSSQTH